MNIRGCLSGSLILILLSSCMVGPNYKRPQVLVPAQFKEEKGSLAKKKNWKPIEPQYPCNSEAWWEIFHNPVLNDLEDQLNKFNQNIVVAYANYRQALAVVDQARSGLYPTITGALNLFRQKQGGGTTTFISSTGSTTETETATTAGTGGLGLTTTTYSALVNASWEPDLWGVVRRTIESDVAAAQSDNALLAYTRLSAQGSLAQYYFELRALDTDQRLLDDTVEAYKKILAFTQHQYASGVVPRYDVVQAQAQLEAQKALALNNGILRGQYEHAIAVLMGRPPAFFTLKPMPLRVTIPDIPIEVPTLWLERRPDIAQAERALQQFSALIGVAVAAYFPTFTLTGSASVAGNTLHHLAHTPSIGWLVGMQLAEVLFDAGLRSATVKAAKEAYYSKVASYRQTVLAAFQDVEDNLVAVRLLKEQLKSQKKAAKSARFALKLILNQYKSGTVNYSNVLTAQIVAFSAQKKANDDAGILMSTQVGLIKSMGGGWSTKSLCPCKN